MSEHEAYNTQYEQAAKDFSKNLESKSSDFIASLMKEADPVDIQEQTQGETAQVANRPVEAAPAGESAPQEAAAEPKVAAIAAATPEAAQEAAPPWAERLMARLTEREQAVAKREKELNEWKRDSRLDVKKFISEKLGLDPNKVARALMGDVLGDQAPPEYRNLQEQVRDRGAYLNEMDELKYQLAEVQSKLTERDQAAQAQYYIQETQQEISKFIQADLSSMPNLAKAVKGDAKYTEGKILSIMREQAKYNLENGINEVPTPAAAAKRLESELNTLAKLFNANTNDSAPAPMKAKLTAGQSQVSGISPKSTDHDERSRQILADVLKNHQG